MFISEDVLKASKNLASDESLDMHFKNIWRWDGLHLRQQKWKPK